MKIDVMPRLNEILREKNLTQTQLSEMTGINQGTLSRFDRNKQHMDVHLVLISRALNMPIEHLFKIYIHDEARGLAGFMRPGYDIKNTQYPEELHPYDREDD